MVFLCPKSSSDVTAVLLTSLSFVQCRLAKLESEDQSFIPIFSTYAILDKRLHLMCNLTKMAYFRDYRNAYSKHLNNWTFVISGHISNLSLN